MSGQDRVVQAALAVAHRGARRRNTEERGGRVLRTVIKLNPAEKAFVTAKARVNGISVPALFMRAVFTGGTEAAAQYEQLREELTGARRLLAGLSVNVNQLARQANAYAAGDPVAQVSVEQLRAAADAVQRAVARIDAVTARATPVGMGPKVTEDDGTDFEDGHGDDDVVDADDVDEDLGDDDGEAGA